MGMLQMTWQPSLLKSLKRKQGAPPLGLRNLGNSCYLNSVLQCLTYTPPLANFCLRYLHSSICDLGAGKEKKGECPFCILEKRITRSLSSEATSDAPSKINNCLRIYAQHFRNGRQEDAHEFLRYVIDACHNTCLRLKKLQLQQRGKSAITNGGDDNGTADTVVKEIFGGALQSQVKCLSCGAESNKVDEIMDISLDILHSGSLREALQKFFQPEVLDGNNKYKCDNCKKLVAAKKQMSILQAPNVLVIQLKRFEGIFGGKIDKSIAFDEILVLSSYMFKGSQDQHPEYNLFGATVHSGFSPDSGHYYAYIKDSMGRWYCCNDSCVSVATSQDVLSEKVYILFFSRTKQRSQNKVGLVANGSKSLDSNGSKTSITNSAPSRDKPIYSRQVSDRQLESNNSTNGCRSSINKSGGLEKPFKMKISAGHPKINSTISQLSSNGNRNPTSHKGDYLETPPREKEVLPNHLESSKPIPAESNCSNSTRMHVSSTSTELVNVKESSNHSRSTDDSTRGKVDQDNYSQPVAANEHLTTGSSEAVCKKEYKEGNGIPRTSVISMKEEKNGLRSNERNGTKEMLADTQNMNGELCSPGICNGEMEPFEGNGSTAVDSPQRSLCGENNANIKIAAHGSLNCNGYSKISSSNNSRMKRKMNDSGSCIFLARDDQSRAKVEAFKEEMGKEASTILHSCGWSDEVYNFMHARKKLCQEEGNASLSVHEKKSLLVGHAKRNLISKIPENLKARLINRLKIFSQEQQFSGT